jgi:hypothetical protein
VLPVTERLKRDTSSDRTSGVPVPVVQATGTRHRWVWAVVSLALVGLRLGWVRYFVSITPTKVIGFTQITSDGLAKGSMVTDGVRLYFSEVSGGRYVLSTARRRGRIGSTAPSNIAYPT